MRHALSLSLEEHFSNYLIETTFVQVQTPAEGVTALQLYDFLIIVSVLCAAAAGAARSPLIKVIEAGIPASG